MVGNKQNKYSFILSITLFFDFQEADGVFSTSYIPRGTRFGPVLGEVYPRDKIPDKPDKKHFWRVSTFFIPVS